ncbi:MAG: hypothetical protein MUP66_01745 [Candidatus Nanohaloarchaeota archaeon QJJ-5]|nr:hypothetical protein [Candidatus Nanohaloarchaeota archaeon QJJ-5]
MTDTVYKIEDGSKEYDNYFEALTVAKAKAEKNETEITIYEKDMHSFEEIAIVDSDGSEERLD